MNRPNLKYVFVGIIFCILAMAAAPSYGQNITIYGCITKSSGQIRIVSTATQCKSNEASISWNQTGPQGPQGAQGIQGIQGIQGLQGLQGPPGVPLGVCPDSDTKTYLLFPFLSNLAGFDTGFSISNTGMDPSGNSGKEGTIKLHFYGASAPPPYSTPSIAQGSSFVNVTSALALGFQGYMIAECNFPFAHGIAYLNGTSSPFSGTVILPTNICIPRVPPR